MIVLDNAEEERPTVKMRQLGLVVVFATNVSAFILDDGYKEISNPY